MARWTGGPIQNLSDACEARRTLWFVCLNCGHAARADPWRLAAKLRRDFTFGELQDRLRCRRCHVKRRVAVVVDSLEAPGR